MEWGNVISPFHPTSSQQMNGILFFLPNVYQKNKSFIYYTDILSSYNNFPTLITLYRMIVPICCSNRISIETYPSMLRLYSSSFSLSWKWWFITNNHLHRTEWYTKCCSIVSMYTVRTCVTQTASSLHSLSSVQLQL